MPVRTPRTPVRAHVAASSRELAQVSWPRRAELVNHSVVVATYLALCIAVLLFVDVLGAHALAWMTR